MGSRGSGQSAGVGDEELIRAMPSSYQFSSTPLISDHCCTMTPRPIPAPVNQKDSNETDSDSVLGALDAERNDDGGCGIDRNAGTSSTGADGITPVTNPNTSGRTDGSGDVFRKVIKPCAGCGGPTIHDLCDLCRTDSISGQPGRNVATGDKQGHGL
jgi:hypothetical protein